MATQRTLTLTRADSLPPWPLGWDELPLIACRTCRNPIPWPACYKRGKLCPVPASEYRQRVCCSRRCSYGPSLTSIAREQFPPKKLQRELSLVEEVEMRIAARVARKETNERTALGPYGHRCAVCRQEVLPGHPLHMAERPERSALEVIFKVL